MPKSADKEEDESESDEDELNTSTETIIFENDNENIKTEDTEDDEEDEEVKVAEKPSFQLQISEVCSLASIESKDQSLTEPFFGFEESNDDSHTSAVIISSESDESNDDKSIPSNSIKRIWEECESDSDSFATEENLQKRTKLRSGKIIEESKTDSIPVKDTLIENLLKDKPKAVKSFIRVQFENKKTKWNSEERKVFKRMYEKSKEYYIFLTKMKFVMPPVKLVKEWISES